jgi:DNA-binding NarL/FixJ family response regulator
MRILLADDQPEVRSALRLLVEQETGLAVAGEANETQALISAVRANPPDLVLLDWELPEPAASQDNTAAKRKTMESLRAICPRLMVIVLSGRPEARKAALEAGANAFVSKGDPPERLLAALHEAAGGRLCTAYTATS